jgi:hypothetical protein
MPGTRPFKMPPNKRVAVKGRVSGVSTLDDVTFAILHLHPKGNRNITYGSAVMKVNCLDEDILEYEAVFEPINRIGDVELQVQLNLEKPIFIYGHMSSIAAAHP